MGSREGAFATEFPPLFTKTRQALLTLLYTRADQEHLQESLIQLAGIGRGTVQRELAYLTSAGVVRRARRGRQIYFQANSDSPIYAELRGLVLKTAGVAGALRASLASLIDRIHVAFIYGSVAKGTERRASDVDVMIIGEVSFADVSNALGQAEAVIGREVNPAVYSPTDFKQKFVAKTYFLSAVLKGDKIFVVGGERELARLVKK